MKFRLFMTSIALMVGQFVEAQTNIFPVYSYGAWSGGSGDYSNTTNAQLKLASSSGYVRVLHVSTDATVNAIYNFQTGKNVYWGETSDNGGYFFRGRSFYVNDGNVGIGTNDTKGYKLAVNGHAIFTKVKVKAFNTWPDYVFDTAYQLPPLQSIASFIKLHRHLPDVPSAQQVADEGIDLGDNQAVLLKKIEELTLYLIEQDKQLQALKEEVRELRKAVNVEKLNQ